MDLGRILVGSWSDFSGSWLDLGWILVDLGWIFVDLGLILVDLWWILVDLGWILFELGCTLNVKMPSLSAQNDIDTRWVRQTILDPSGSKALLAPKVAS